MSLLENLNWRYATKRFQKEKVLDERQIETLKQAIKLSPSSYGLQPYKVLVVSNKELKETLKPASWDQPQITECSHLFVFCQDKSYSDKLVDDYITLKADTQNLERDDLKDYADFMKDKMGGLSDEDYLNWSGRQTYLALAHLLMACANERIDACPMEGFEPERYVKILGLETSEYRPVALAAVGYRSDEDSTQHQKKVRKPLDALIVSYE